MTNEGNPQKQPLKITLLDGREIVGVFQKYVPASLLFVIDGEAVDVDFELIPEELQACFPNDPTVTARNSNREVTAKAAELTEAVHAHNDSFNSQMEILGDLIDNLGAERDALAAELEAARRELEQREE